LAQPQKVLFLKFETLSFTRLQLAKTLAPRDLTDWRVKRILDAIEAVVHAKRAHIPKRLSERFEANWPAIIHQIRTARNDADIPVDVEPVTADEVHASLLVFPQLATLAYELKSWD
jgi:hypothetical protein